jgi:hypothetical protein
MSPEEFWSSADVRGPDDCWLWQGYVFPSGYGGLTRSPDKLAHRAAWMFSHGPIPKGFCVCHSCDVRYPVGDKTNRKCVNPAHLWLGTYADNGADMVRKGRSASGDRNSSRLYPERLSRGDEHYSRNHPEKLLRGEKHWTHIHPEKIARGDRSSSRLHPDSYRGEQNAHAKLKSDQILDIRRRYAKGNYTLLRLGMLFNVHLATISKIVRRKAWNHI